MTRGISTVLDASVCLLLVSASALALVGIPADESDPDRADEAAETLASSTARVSYDDGSRTAHGTLAGLLAATAVRNATLGESRLLADTGLARAVTERVERSLGRVEYHRVQVIARWEPFPSASLRGRVAAGPTPPPGVDVHAAAFSVSSGLPSVRSSARAAGRGGGFERVARAIAGGVVRGLFPPIETRTALGARPDRAARAVERYRTSADAVGARSAVEEALTDGNATRATRIVTDALATLLEPTLRERFDGATDAARETAVGRVRITVRTWSR
ncbi:DUF7284 family protein [Halorussus marinus]|uniref:DUF7284 family protein n=1 Tax=Halorussus marinus TaxID=2505976 RepID=UPI001092B494|nr:hypothetical protein [Halorussus marinus]